MKTVKVAETAGVVLDYLVDCLISGKQFASDHSKYSSDWAHGGPIIEREKISLKPNDTIWVAYAKGKLVDITYPTEGNTPLIAAMRCFVASKLGETAEVPEELG